MTAKLLVYLVQIYQVSVDGLRAMFGITLACKFVPSCSQYTKVSIKKHGAWRGSILGLKRILRCNPFNQGGIDLPS